MANQRHVDILLRDGVNIWNLWRNSEVGILPDLTSADLSRASLTRVDLRRADLNGADLRGATLTEALLCDAFLREARLGQVSLAGADLTGAHLLRTNLRQADLHDARLNGADLTGADLRGARLAGADLNSAILHGANLREADLSGAHFVRTDLTDADLSGCTVYGVSVWDANLTSALQADLRITPPDSESAITTDNLEVAQFLYLMLQNQKVRAVLDTLTSKVVLILGRFSEERKHVLDVLREALRARDYVPVLFDFSGSENRDMTETVALLARMARFVIADLTDPGSVPYELATIVPDAHVPVQPLLLKGATTFSMAGDLWLAREMLPVVRYTSAEELAANLTERVTRPAEAKVAEIQRARATALLRSGLS